MLSAVGFLSETWCPQSTNWFAGQKVLTSKLYNHKYHFLRVFFVCFFSFAIPPILIFFASTLRTKLLISIAYSHIDIVVSHRGTWRALYVYRKDDHPNSIKYKPLFLKPYRTVLFSSEFKTNTLDQRYSNCASQLPEVS